MPDVLCSPRVVGELRPDCHSLEEFLADRRFAGKSGEALVLAIYDYFTSPLDGSWHFWPSDEREGQPLAGGRVEDPLKLLNCYGWMICGQHAAMLQGVYRAAGLPSRIRGLPGHTVCEVFYDGRWHILDVDMWTWFRTPDGHLAGIEELAAAPRALILDNRQRSDPCDLPDRALADYAAMYEQAAKQEQVIFPLWATRAHCMDFALRPGETLIRSQASAGRFVMPRSWEENLTRFAGEWAGRPRERYQPFRTVGNGRLIYAPDLSARTRDVELGAWTRDRLQQDDAGLVGPGSIVFRIQTPYPFCGIPDPAAPGFPARDGVQLELAGSGEVRAEVSDAEGRYATVAVAVAAGGFARRDDLTALLAARYDCLLRLTLADGARLTALRFDGYTMVAPMSLPRLAAGGNRMELRCLDQHRLRTVPWDVPVDFRSEAALRATLVAVKRGRLLAGDGGRLRIAPAPDGAAVAVFRFDAPPQRPFAWAYAIATVPEGPADAPARQATLEWSADGADWRPLAGIAIPNTRLQWDGSIDGEVRPPAPLSRLWLRASSGTGITALEFAGHLAEPASPAQLRIVHRWREAGAEREFAPPAGATAYTVTCGADPCDHAIEMRVPSLPR